MKTTTQKPAKAANSKTTTRTLATSKPALVAEVPEELTPGRKFYSDAAGRESGVYWTTKQPDGLPPASWKIPVEQKPPHAKLCEWQFGTLKSLVKRLEEFGWQRSAIVNLARVRISGNDYQVEFFPTLAAARAAEKEMNATIL